MENDTVIKMIRWFRENELTWDYLTEQSNMELLTGDITDMLEELIEQEMYESAVILLAKREKTDRTVRTAVSNIIEKNLRQMEGEKNLLTSCMEEIKELAGREEIL